MKATRLLSPDDAPVLADVLRANREFHAPWDPIRGERYYTVEGQRAVIADALAQYERGAMLPHAIVDSAGRLVGRVNLNDIVRGAFQSGNLGYWLAEAATGQGLASAAVRETIRVAFEEMKLHRIQAGTLPHNARSQRVLVRNGFERIGVARAYLKIAGKWQDHVLFQLINPALV